jgi:TPR repeat protein
MKESDDLYGRALAIAENNDSDRSSLKKVFGLLTKANEAGDSRATYAIGTWYLFGKYVEKDLKKGYQYIKVAAEKNNPDALYDLAVFYEKGVVVRKNCKTAFKLYLKAALHEDRKSFYEVGRCLFHGIGVKQDKVQANIWLDRAEEFGFTD